jgi:hypothetical protein
MTMTAEKFKKITGEDIVEWYGEDWEDHIDEIMEDSHFFHDGHEIGGCIVCTMDR